MESRSTAKTRTQPKEVSKCNASETDCTQFEAGRLKHFLPQWENITSDPFILQMVQGFKIDFVSEPFVAPRAETKVGKEEEKMIDKEIMKLLNMKVIEQSSNEKGEVISPIFTRPKADGSLRLILNLKKMNESVKYEHFKMEGIENVLAMMKSDCYMASIDLKHAYYSLPVHDE